MERQPKPSTGGGRFYPLKEVKSRLNRAIQTSPADETEVVWFERKRGWAENPSLQNARLEAPILTILIRVVEGGRMGWHRTEAAHPRELENGIREALALAKVQERVKKRPVFPSMANDPRLPPAIIDREISDLGPAAALALLAALPEAVSTAKLSWSDNRLAVYNSHGLKRTAAATEVSLEVKSGIGHGAGYAAGSARSLKGLDMQGIAARAHALRTKNSPACPLPDHPIPILFSPEATIELLNILNMFAFSARTYLDGTSFLTRHRNVQVFNQGFNLRDDGLLESGLPFPFDLEGSPKVPLDLIVAGRPSTPALNRDQGARAGLEPTAQAVGGSDSLCGNLFMAKGDLDEGQLLAQAEGGLRVGWLEPPECFEPTQLRLRAIARGVRKIEAGRLGDPVPDFVWEDSLLRSLALLRAVGNQTVTLNTRSTPLGGISAPAIVIGECADLRLLTR